MDKIFYILAALTLIAAFMVVISRHPIRSVLFLVATFFLISAQYILLNAQFLALVNIIVYAGAIMVLFLFVIMFLNLSRDLERFASWMPIAAAGISVGGIGLLLLASYRGAQISTDTVGNYDSGLVEQIGEVLYRDYLFPMEVCSVLFLVAMIGIVLLNRKERELPAKLPLP
ncbi:MAG: NADH-quinone oxidoreductase subunit J [Saprospiraceae bacterium]|jgi:NADH-quinone oxidoreductase subunit J|nr:NADH-quinone oxidoreductase subunit J [Saprospiraceae bacterium]MBP9210334.1 NADH-quinone oxidoreductase subunit J [Saprospiraceae bacterium]MBV6474031.1 NADH-quinone oxidoreductase subunit J [Saprospiraceae bacterium]